MAPNAPLLPLNNQSVLVRPSVRAVAPSYERNRSTSVEWYDVSGQRETSLVAGEVWDMNERSEVLCSNFFTGTNPVRQYQVLDRKGGRRTVASVPYFGTSCINDKGQVVGLSTRALSSGQPNRRLFTPIAQQGPFWCGDKRLYDLNALIPANSGWTVLQVRDFNERGEILVYAQNASERIQTLLLRPVATKAKLSVVKKLARR